VRFLTNAAGTVTDAYEYDAFGNKVASTGTTPNVYLYRGEQYDPDLGLYYLRARYYNSLTGRFLSRDPLSGEPDDPKTLHKYLYAYGDPVNGFDPSGKGIAEGDALFTFPETIADKVLSRTGLRIASCFAGLADAIYGLTHDLGAHTLWGTFWAYFGCIDTFTPE
jgi:RHS repeat-associated protein